MMEIWQGLLKVTAGLHLCIFMGILLVFSFWLYSTLLLVNKSIAYVSFEFFAGKKLSLPSQFQIYRCYGCIILCWSISGIWVFARPLYWTERSSLNSWTFSKEVHYLGMNSQVQWRRHTRAAWANLQKERSSLGSPRKRTISMLILKNALAPMGDLETLPDNASWKHVANEYWCLNLIAHPFVRWHHHLCTANERPSLAY